MALTFKGTKEDLQAKLAELDGDWSETNGNVQLRCVDGGILCWAPSTRRIWFQGREEPRKQLEALVSAILLGSKTPPPATAASPSVSGRPQQKTTIFVVHGHDTEAREQLELALHRLGLDPFVLMNSSGGGNTIVEALEQKIGRNFTSDFGIVLWTPDDVGYTKSAGPDKADARARQNVVLEAGMLLASLTRKRVAFMVRGHIEMPSDLQGVIYAHFNAHVREALPKVIARMQEAGIQIDPQKIAAATS